MGVLSLQDHVLWRFIMKYVEFNWCIAYCNVIKVRSQIEWVIQTSWWLNVNSCCSEQRGTFTRCARHCRFWSWAMELNATCCVTLQIAMRAAELLNWEGVYWCWMLMCHVSKLFGPCNGSKGGQATLAELYWALLDWTGGRAILALWVRVLFYFRSSCCLLPGRGA
jgi:hypothetical protein